MAEVFPTELPRTDESDSGFVDPALTDPQLAPIGSTAPYVGTDPAVTRVPSTTGGPIHLPDSPTVSLRDAGHEGGVPEQPMDAESEKERKLALAEQWLGTQTKQFTPNTVLLTSAEASGEPIPAEFEQTEPVPEALASEVALLTQKRIGLWGKYDIMSDEIGGDTSALKVIRDQALGLARELDFGVVQYSDGSELRMQLNAMHEKFKDVKVEDLAGYLASDDDAYEYKALYIRNIIADHAPELLTKNIRTFMDSTQPLWRVTSTHASILLRNRVQRRLGSYQFDRIPVALPAGSRSEYIPEDDQTVKPVSDMSDDELALYCIPQATAAIRERGTVLFAELNMPARESLLTRRLFEISVKSGDPAIKDWASNRNRALEGTPPLEEGDLVHATPSPEFFEDILHHGLQCTESVVDSTPRRIDFPFTVSFLRVDENIAAEASVPARLAHLGNEGYGSINIVMSRDPSSTDYGREQQTTMHAVSNAARQYQLFGGAPSTEIKRVVIRENIAPPGITKSVIDKIVKNGMFIPVYSGSTGELLFSSEQFDQLQAQSVHT